MESGEMPPPLSTQAVSDFQGPPRWPWSGRPADGNDVRVVCGPGLITRRPGGRVAGGRKEVLALRRHLFKVRSSVLGRRASSPTNSRWWWAMDYASSWR